jgi:tetratricopeptide (TPR) repeat protein
MSKLPSTLLYRILIFCFFFALSGELFESTAAGLPQEYLLTQRWRTLFSQNSPVTNPVFINDENYLSARIVYSPILTEFRTLEAGVVYPIGLFQAGGISVLYQGIASPYNQTSMAPNGDIINLPNEPKISENTTYIMGTYAYNIWSGLNIGMNANFMMRNFFNTSSQGAGVDLGISYRLLQHPVIGTHIVGANIQNALYVALGNKDDVLPRALRLSLNSTYFERQIESSFDFSLRDIGTATSNFTNGKAAGEWNLDGKIGGWAIRIAKAYLLFGATDEALSYLGIGIGANVPSINNGRDLSLMIQYLNLLQVEEQPAMSFISFYARTDIGKHREEIYARKMAKLANMEPNDLYIKGVNLYTEGNYWDAFFIFSRLFVEYPDFFKNDWVSFFLGSCQENLDMRLTAEEAFNKTKEQYSRSAAVPFADLGLMRVYYRDGNFGAVENQFNELNKLGVPDSIKYHAYYYMGQTEMKKQSYSKAKQLFELIPETHPDFVFAQHSSAVCNALEDNIEGAISNLESCIQAQITTNAQKEIVNRSYVFLGYMFYEELTKQEGPLAKAVTALRMVPKESYFYPDALLGLAWTALKARQWNDCKSAAQQIQQTAGNAVTKAEGALLEAYAYMVEKNYNTAVTLLDDASKSLSEFKLPSQAELMSKQDENNAVRGKYTEVARKAYDLGTSRQSELVIKQIDSLHVHQKELKTNIDEFLDFVDVFERGAFFSRNFETVQEDVDYALARAEKLGGQVQEMKKIEGIKSEEQKLNEEIEKAKAELDKTDAKDAKKDVKKEEKKEIKKEEKKKVESAPSVPQTKTPSPLPEEDVPMDEPFDEGDEEGIE